MTVLDDGDGAELCLGGVMDSYPPQCGGPSLVGWDWADHRGDFESASDVRWGDFVVTGTFDGTSVTPSDVVPADEFEEPDDSAGFEDDGFATPCPRAGRRLAGAGPAPLTTDDRCRPTMMRARAARRLRRVLGRPVDQPGLRRRTVDPGQRAAS